MTNPIDPFIHRQRAYNAIIEYNRKMTALGVMLITGVIAVVAAPLIVVIFIIKGIAG